MKQFQRSKIKDFLVWLSCLIGGHRWQFIKMYKYTQTAKYKCGFCLKQKFYCTGGEFEGCSVPWSEEGEEFWSGFERIRESKEDL